MEAAAKPVEINYIPILNLAIFTAEKSSGFSIKTSKLTFRTDPSSSCRLFVFSKYVIATNGEKLIDDIAAAAKDGRLEAAIKEVNDSKISNGK